MKKYLLISLITCLTPSFHCFAQTVFFPLGTGVNSGPGLPFLFADTSTTILYTGGWITSIGNVPVQGMARWNGFVWDSMGYGITPRAITKYNGEIIVGGTYGSLTNQPSGRGLSKWNGSAWIPFADAISSSGLGCVDGLLVRNNDLYVFGCFDSIAGMPANMIAKYDGTNWYTFPVLDTANGGGVIFCAAFYNNELYVGGNFEFPYQSLRGEIAKWDGTAWQEVDSGITGSLASVGALEVFNNELWVGGGFETAWGDAGNYLMKWNGTNWVQLPCEPNGFVYDLQVYGGKMYAGGTFNVPSITNGWWSARWTNTGSCESYGIFDNGPIGSFTELNGELYIGGGFWTVNGDTMNRITRYTGAVGIDNINNEKHVTISPNPTNGIFSIAFPENISSIQITNVLGQKIYTSEINSSKSEIDLSDKPKGIYFVRIIAEEKISTQKIIIQ
jgi:hypothetical protein